MSVFIAKKILKKQPQEKQTDARLRNLIGAIASFVGIIANCLIGVSKLIVGLIFSSISVASDGLNNISDTASSAVSMISFKIADKPADKTPFRACKSRIFGCNDNLFYHYHAWSRAYKVICRKNNSKYSLDF